MNKKIKYLTPKGKQDYIDRLKYLKTVKKDEIGEQLKYARSFGDLSENSEYDEAKNAMAANEYEIEKIENILKYAILVDENDIPEDAIFIGSKVKLLDVEFNEEEDYEIVGAGEADPFANKISNESPLGEALLHKKVDDEVVVQSPGGQITFRVMAIYR